jgi:hypothetical protein
MIFGFDEFSFCDYQNIEILKDMNNVNSYLFISTTCAGALCVTIKNK